MGEVAAIGSLMGGAASLGGMLFGNNDAAEMQAQLAANAQQNAANQQRYQASLNAEAMRRAIAGMTDAQGNTISYDPATNRWNTVLSARGATQQNASDNANLQRNTTEFQRQLRSNEGAERRGMAAESAANPMLEQIKRFQNTDPRALEGDLQQASALAHRETFRPVVDSTLRQFARTGSSAGPVLADIGAKSYDSLRRSMLDNVIKSKTGAVELDNARRGGLVNDYAKLNSQATPNFAYSPISTDGPSQALSAAIASRSGNASTSANYAAMGVPGSTNAFSNAAQMGINTVPNSNLFSAQLQGIGQMLSNPQNPLIKAIGGWFGSSGGGNAGDGGYIDTGGWNS